MRAILISIISINICFATVSETECDVSDTPFLYVHLKDQDRVCDSARELEQMIYDISKFSSALFHEKIGVVFHLKERADYSYKEFGELNIARIESYWRPGQWIPLKVIKTLWAHEYGHSMLSINLSQELNSFKKMKEGAKNGLSEEFTGLKNISTPYHELFADLVSILYMEDPRAQVKVGDFYQMIFDDLLPHFSQRDFTTPFLPSGWSTFYINGVLAPTRYHIWKNFWQESMSDTYKERVVMALYRAIVNELSLGEGLISFTQEELNLRLIKQLSSL